MDNLDYDIAEFEDEWETVQHFNQAPVSHTDNDITENTLNSEHIKTSQPKVKRKLTGTQKIIKYQLILCALLRIIATAWKFISNDTFSKFSEWYHNQLNSELVITDVFNFTQVNTDEIQAEFGNDQPQLSAYSGYLYSINCGQKFYSSICYNKCCFT